MIPIDPGGIRDATDERDYQYQNIAAIGIPFDWNKGFDIEQALSEKLGILDFKLPVKDQNGSLSCGGQAWSTYHSVLEAMNTGTFEEYSAKFIYAQTAVQGGGSSGRDNSDLLIKDGCCREMILTSYEDHEPPSESFMTRKSDLTPSVYSDAGVTKVTSYANVVADIDLFAQAIRDNHGLVIGVSGENNGTWGSTFPKPPQNRKWGHWIYAGKAKMINDKKYIGILNSWGKDVGESGWQWIGEDYFDSGNVWNGWTILFNIKPKHIFNINMKYGDFNDEVQYLQKVLRLTGDFTYPDITGYYGFETAKAVLAYQLRNNIIKVWQTPFYWRNYSRVGPLTRASLNK